MKKRKPAPASGAHPVRVGTAGWSIPRASADEVPGDGSHLHRFSRVLSCAEINSSFYRSPRLSTYVRWAESVPETFRFSVKAPRAITHEAALDCTPAKLRSFLDEAAALGHKLGPLLFQLPPSLAFDTTRAQAFFSTLRELFHGPAVLEPRHASWFTPEVDSLLKTLQISRVAADPARTPEAALPGGLTALLYYRLHGSPRTYYSSYSADFLQELAATFQRHVQAGGASEIWCIFDNTASGAAAANALALNRYLQAEQRRISVGPEPYLPR